MKIKVTGEEPFQVLAHSFAVSPSTSGFTLAYSADGEHFTNYTEHTAPGLNLMVNSTPKNVFFKLVGNTDTVNVVY